MYLTIQFAGNPHVQKKLIPLLVISRIKIGIYILGYPRRTTMAQYNIKFLPEGGLGIEAETHYICSTD